MNNQSLSRRWILLLLMIVLLGSLSCRVVELIPRQEIRERLTSPAPEGDISPREVDGYELPQYLGYIADPDGIPVPFATVGGTETATLEGVVSGDFAEYQGQWIPVEAPGYAPGYARSWIEGPESHFFDARLTPFHSLVLVEGNESYPLQGELEGILSVQVEIPGEIVPQTPAYLGLAVMDPLDVDSRFEETEMDPGLRVQAALSLQAYDEEWQPLEVSPEGNIPMRLELSRPLTPGAAFAVFDPVASLWREVDLDCAAAGEGAYNCRLDTLPALLAVFDLPRVASSKEGPLHRVNYQPSGAWVSAVGPNQDSGQSGDQAYQEALDKLADYIKRQEDNGTLNPDDPVLKELVRDLVDLALEFLANHPDESGKRTGLKAAQAALMLGQEEMAGEIMAKLEELSDKLGEEALKEEDCGKFRDLLKAAEQIMYLSDNSDLARKLIEKAREMTQDCDQWRGTITVHMFAPQNHPAGLPMEATSGGSWMEVHDVRIFTDVDDHQMTGWSSVQHTLPTIKFRRDVECKEEISCSGQPGKTRIEFEGFFDGYSFQVNSITTEGEGAKIQQKWDFHDEEDGQCKQIYQRDFQLPHYYSLIFHGISSESPPINLQEILDSSQQSVREDGIDSFRGFEKINNPDPDLGIFPFTWGSISWSFQHVEKKLPLEEEGTGG